MPGKILVVDDEEIVIKTYIRVLEKQGYQVFYATHFSAALDIVKAHDFDLLLCDIRMPGQDGAKTTEQIQALRLQQGRKIVPVIFITGYADESLEKKVDYLKPAAYLYKPFDISKLLETIQLQLP